MQPMINPNYFSQYQPYQPNFQNYSQNTNNMTRLVNDFSEIQVNEIPMDGSYKLFAKNDMSEVQARAWNSNGTISIMEYSLKQPCENLSTNNSPQIDLTSQFEPIMAEIKALNEKIDKLTKPTKRKEVVTEDDKC